MFVAYQLWGTGVLERSSQARLRLQLGTVERVAASDARTDTTLHWTPRDGEAVGRIEIPKIGLDQVVVEGTSAGDLRLGPGHYPGTPLPGETGNVAIAGHRTTYGAPFYNLDRLAPGDRIVLTTPLGRFVYAVQRTLVVAPTDLSVVRAHDGIALTLTTCNPRFSATERLVVEARLVASPASSRPIVLQPSPTSSRPPPSSPDLAGPIALATAAAAAVAAGLIGAIAAGRRSRHRLLIALGTAPIVLGALYVLFFELSAVLPPSI